MSTATGRPRPGRWVIPAAVDIPLDPVITAPATRRDGSGNRWRAAAAAAVLLVVLAGCGWWATGGRWMIVATPSMGQAAPVGTVVFTRPVDITHIALGQVISFHPPAGSMELYRLFAFEGVDRVGASLPG